MTTFADPTVTKWSRWISNIYLECHRLFEHRYVFQGLHKVISENNSLRDKNAVLFNFITVWFCDSMLMAIRRLAETAKTAKDSIGSLILLLDEISNNPKLITLDAYMKANEESLKNLPPIVREKYAQKLKEEFCSMANPIDGHIDPDVVVRDKTTFEMASAKCKDLATRRVAHRSRKPVSEVTFGELYRCIDLAIELSKKYCKLIRGSPPLFSTNRLRDWDAVLKEPWLA